MSQASRLEDFVAAVGADVKELKTASKLQIGSTAPTPPTGEQVLWLDTTGGNVTLNLVTGD